MTYRKFDGIFETMDSFFQGYPDIELIIADDGSPDADEQLSLIENYINDNKNDNITNMNIIKGRINVETVKIFIEQSKLLLGSMYKI